MQPKPSTATPAACPSVDELASFVDKQASPSLLARVLNHVDECHDCRVLIATALRSSNVAIEDARAIGCAPRTLPLGEVVGQRYRVDHLISRGGMGEVYQVWDLQLQETVALKTIACTVLDDAKLYVWIRKEVQLARKVTHPNVCRILEFGLHRQAYRGREEVIPFFTMEFLNGETLAAYMARNGRLPLTVFLQIASQILQGMAAIHAAGIVHRDLKPENIFLLRNDSGDFRAIVMDFGLARRQDTRNSISDSSARAAVGTPTYMAPEQSLGGVPTVKWDIFALGVIFFQAVTGQLPFKGKTTVALAIARIQESAPALSSIVPGIDSNVEALVAGCLERNPAQRFDNVGEVQQALQEIASRRPIRQRLGAVSIPGLALAIGTAACAIGFVLAGRHHIRQPDSPNVPASAMTAAVARDGQTQGISRVDPPRHGGALESEQLHHRMGTNPTNELTAPLASAAVGRKPTAAGGKNSRRMATVSDTAAAASKAPDIDHLVVPTVTPAHAPTDDEIVIPSFAGTGRRMAKEQAE